MNVKFWQPGRNYASIKEEIDYAIEKTLLRGELVLGFSPAIEEFEERFAKLVGVKYAVMCGAGTQALYLAYRALGIGPGDEVITVSHTFAATIDQIVAVGATPVLVDIGEDGLMDPALVEKAITPKTKAIVPVHLEGKMCDMTALSLIAVRHRLPLIEDAAQALGASQEVRFTINHKDFEADLGETRKAGSLGVIGCFSLFPAKILGSYGNAGMLTTNDEYFYNKLKMLRCNFNLGKNQDLKEGDWGVNMEPDGIQAAILNVKVEYLGQYLAQRKEIAHAYNEAFRDLSITLPVEQPGRVYQDYVIRVKDKAGLVAYLQEKGVGILGHNLIPNHKYPKLGLNFHLPITEKYIAEQIRIPCNPDLSSEEVTYVIDTIKEYYA